MTTVTLADLPAALARVADAAATLGWTVTATAADGPPANIALRFASPVGAYRCFGVWHLDGGSVKFKGAAARHVPPGRLPTLRALKSYLGVS